jgi:hypothetical protein
MADKNDRLDFAIEQVVKALENALGSHNGWRGQILPVTREVGSQDTMTGLL